MSRAQNITVVSKLYWLIFYKIQKICHTKIFFFKVETIEHCIHGQLIIVIVVVVALSLNHDVVTYQNENVLWRLRNIFAGFKTIVYDLRALMYHRYVSSSQIL